MGTGKTFQKIFIILFYILHTYLLRLDSTHYIFSSEEYPWENHMSASTNDLRRLFEEELELISKVELYHHIVN